MKIYKCKEVFKKLKKYDPNFEVLSRRGKGGHKMLYHPGRKKSKGVKETFKNSLPLPCHSGGTELKISYYKQIQRRFNLDDDFF